VEQRPLVTLFSPDSWLAETLQRAVYRWSGAPEDVEATALQSEMKRLSGDCDALFFARVGTSDVATAVAFERAGFRIVDTAVTFVWSEDTGDSPPSIVSVSSARRDQHEAVADIATRAFRWSRFHLDPMISTEDANRVKREWVENYCRGARGAAIYAAELDGTTVGFLAVLQTSSGDRRIAVIDLVGVAPEAQGKGAGGALIRHFIESWKSEADELRVGTQVANIRSVRLYEQAGFRMAASAYVLHAHYRRGEPRS
jgi:ribosomal protein S18 acetylase RimI-like enzyme